MTPQGISNTFQYVEKAKAGRRLCRYPFIKGAGNGKAGQRNKSHLKFVSIS